MKQIQIFVLLCAALAVSASAPDEHILVDDGYAANIPVGRAIAGVDDRLIICWFCYGALARFDIRA